MQNDGNGNINVPSLTIRGADGKKGGTIVSTGENKLSIDASAGIFFNGPTGLITASGGINTKAIGLYGTMACNNNSIFFCADGNTHHGINYQPSPADGPILYGSNGGALGIGPKDSFKAVLAWNHNGIESKGLLRAHNAIQVSGGLHLGGSGTMVCNGVPILFKSDGDYQHGIQCNIGNFDGPYLFGNKGGGLGIRPGGNYKHLLEWNDSNVTVTNQLTVEGGIESKGLLRAHNAIHVSGGLHLGGSGTMVCNGVPILFKNDGNYDHGIQCNIAHYDGPSLFGNTGGALGVRPGGVYTSLLQWNYATVFIERKLAFSNNSFEIFAKNDHLLINNLNTKPMEFLVGYKDHNNGTGGVTGAEVHCWFNGKINYRASDKYSDYRLKKNIKDIGNITTLNLRPVEYDWKSGVQDHSLGFIAHEVQEIIPCIVSGEKDGEKMQTISMESIIPVLVKDFQRMHKTITEQESRIAKLESQISYLMNRLA
jgi:hypothetical protein